MDYEAHYDKLMYRAKGRKISGYRERHHIIPKCLGGTQEPSNVVELTAAEHYVAHQLLVKIYPHSEALAWAAMNMTGKSWKHSGRKNKLYGWVRARVAQEVSTRLRGKPKSEKHRQALSAAKLGKKRGPHSAIHRARQSASIRAAIKNRDRSIYRTPEYKQRQSEQMKRIWAKRRALTTEDNRGSL